MRDGRTTLKSGSKITLDKDYKIIREIGRGASCIVYEATYTDAKELEHYVRIKEFFPFEVNIERENDELIVKSGYQAKYAELKKQFEEAYLKNVEIKKIVGLVNYTVDSLETYEKNNTVYSIMTTIEGEDYEKYRDENLSSVFNRVGKLCSILNKYHKHDYLHLDIKPANILITQESMYLFDFDSIISKDELKSSATLRISCSRGFSAPELMMGAQNAICEATDIFSLGAIVYYKMFGKVPGLKERQRNAVYNYDDICSNFEKIEYPKKFYEKMDEFFHKTLASAPGSRYQSMVDVGDILRELEGLTNKTSLLVDNFKIDNSSNFVGRQKEIRDIEKAFEDTNFIFLSGMGGIGKTELAKQVASKLRKNGTVDRVAFLNYEHNLKDTICSHNLAFSNWEEEEIDSVTVDKKIKKLREVTDKPGIYGGDLIIIDNLDEFDIETEVELLLELVNCKAKFIFTRREENLGVDLGTKEIEVSQMSDSTELWEVFRKNNSHNYSEDEVDRIFKIIDFVDRHTMTVVLIAKYLRDTKEQPSYFSEKLLEKEGITNTGEKRVLHTKIVKKPVGTVNQHLLALFDLSQFDKAEKELLSCLSLFGAVKLKRSFLVHLFNGLDVDEVLDQLIIKGWVEENDEKISLHQVILDLIFNFLLDEEAENIILIENLCDYCEEKVTSRSQKKSKEKLIANVIERIPYKSIRVALLCLKYFQKVKADKEYLMKADVLCEQKNEIEWQKIKLKIICEEVKHMSREYGATSFENDENPRGIFKEIWKTVQNKEDLFFDITKKIILSSNYNLMENDDISIALTSFEFPVRTELAELLDDSMEQELNDLSALLFKLKVWKGSDYGHVVDDDLIEIYYSLYQSMRTLEKTISSDFFWESLSAFDEIRTLYSETKSLLEFILEYALKGNISYQLQEKICSEAAEFFGDIDYCEEARSMIVGDLEKSAFYDEKLKQLYQESGKGTLITGIEYYDAAASEKFNGNYDSAYKLIQMAFEKGEITEDIFLYEKADYLIENEKFELALKCLKNVLVYDRAKGLDSIYTNKRIIDLYSKWGKGEDALKICRDLLAENKSIKKKTDDTIRTFLYLCTKMNELNNREHYKIEEIKDVKNGLSEISDDSGIDAELFPTYMMYFKSLIQYDNLETAIEWLFIVAEKCRIQGYAFYDMTIKLYSEILKYAKSIIDVKLHIFVKSLLWYTELSDGGFLANHSEGVSTCNYVKSLLKEHTFEDWEYCQALMLKVKTRFYLEAMNYPRKEYEEDCLNCNYYILTERTLKEGSAVGRTYEVWKECFSDAMNARNEIIALKALNQMTAAIKAWNYDSEEERVCDEVDLCFRSIRFYISLKSYEKVREEILTHIRKVVETNDIYRWNRGFDEIRNSLVEISELMSAIVFSAYGILCCLKCSSDYNEYIQSLFDEKNNDLFLKKVIDILPEEVEEGNKDDILKKLEFVVKASAEIESLKEFNENCQTAIKRYNSTDVEFKR